MPDPSEIAAAVNRLRRYNAGVPAHLIWSTLESDWKIADERMRQDTDTLAAAYLDEHAKTKPIRQLKPRKITLDDEDADEPVTRESRDRELLSIAANALALCVEELEFDAEHAVVRQTMEAREVDCALDHARRILSVIREQEADHE